MPHSSAAPPPNQKKHRTHLGRAAARRRSRTPSATRSCRGRSAGCRAAPWSFVFCFVLCVWGGGGGGGVWGGGCEARLGFWIGEAPRTRRAPPSPPSPPPLILHSHKNSLFDLRTRGEARAVVADDRRLVERAEALGVAHHHHRHRLALAALLLVSTAARLAVTA